MKKYILFMGALITVSAGCKKEKLKEPVCRINKLTNRFGKEIKITYNADGNCAKIEDDYVNQTTTISYNSTAIVITRANTGTGTYISRTTLSLNSSGMIDAQRDEYYNASASKLTGSVKSQFEYNGSQLIKATTIDSFFSQQSVVTASTNYTWKDGNLIAGVSATRVDNYEYYTDKPFQQGDSESIYRLIRGYDINRVIKNKNLAKSRNTWQYSYEFDTEGKVKATKYNGSPDYLVEYECN